MSVQRVVVGLGSNLGDRLAHLQSAVDGLASAEGVRVVSVSSVYETDPVGPPQPPYLNAAALLETTLTLAALHALTRDLELARGRVRAERWGPRTLDIDLLWADLGVRTPELTVPHPRLTDRAFALAPLLDVLPTPPVALARRLSALGGPPEAARETLSSPK